MKESLKDKVVRLAEEFVEEAYPLTLSFPIYERFTLAGQLRRALISIPANIIEGAARGSNKQFYRFLCIAYASLAEAKYLLKFAFKRGYIEKEIYKKVHDKAEELSKLLYSLKEAVKESLT